MKLLAKFTYKEWEYYWLTKCINKNHVTTYGYIHLTYATIPK